MNYVSDDAAIVQFYDQLFEIASRIVKRGETHAPIVIVLNTAGGVRALSLVGLLPDQRASLFFFHVCATRSASGRARDRKLVC